MVKQQLSLRLPKQDIYDIQTFRVTSLFSRENVEEAHFRRSEFGDLAAKKTVLKGTKFQEVYFQNADRHKTSG